MATKKASATSSTKKRTTPRKKTTKKSVSEPSFLVKDSFRIVKDRPPFMTFKITVQTVYWTLLVAVIIFLQLWILQAQYKAVQSTEIVSRSIDSYN